MDNRKTNLFVKVRSAERLIFEGNAISLSSINDKGPFDILPTHTNFISIIKNKLTILDLAGVSHEVALDIGILRFYRNRVDIFLGVLGAT